jgi:hypothetical protein
VLYAVTFNNLRSAHTVFVIDVRLSQQTAICFNIKLEKHKGEKNNVNARLQHHYEKKKIF